MFPILFSIGPLQIFNFSIFLIAGWLVFSFVFWKLLRAVAVPEDRIFDLTFYATIAAIVGGRLGYVFLHRDLFANDWLATAALWVVPGLSLYGALIAGLAMLVALARSYRVRLGHVLDSVAYAFPAALILGKIGSLLDGAEVGLSAALPWAVSYAGHVGRRHPVQVYELLWLIVVLVLIWLLGKRGERDKWPYGLVGIWFVLLFSIGEFALEFFKENPVYLGLRANQWVLVALFAESLGAFYVRGGGREKIRPVIANIKRSIYAKFSK
ncbi:prolipoprotein diacylglyceryl transferase [Candidatus Gottesmanbacteria bacterium]|nr:prolipoprotein diacylglyceryl transferase [Candidatus Gottesmanbacteria bacterium]